MLISIRIVSFLHQVTNPARLFYLFTFLPFYLCTFLPFYLFTFLPLNVPCFTQPFCTFACEKTRSMIPRDFRTEFRLAEGTPIPKQSRNIPETIPKDRQEPFSRKLNPHLTGSFPAFHRAGKQNVSRPLKSLPQQPRLSLKNCFIVLLNT